MHLIDSSSSATRAKPRAQRRISGHDSTATRSRSAILALLLLCGVALFVPQYALACDWALPGGSDSINVPLQPWHQLPGKNVVQLSYQVHGSSLTFRSIVEYEVPVMQARVAAIDKKRAEELQLESPGVLVEWVEVGGVADNRGIVKGDIIVELDDEPATGPDWVANRIRHHDLEAPVKLKVLSNGATRELLIPLVMVTKREPRRESHALELVKDRQFTGISFGVLPVAARKVLTGSDSEGIVVADIQGGSPGFYSVLRSGDVLLSLDGAPIADGKALLAIIRKEVERGNRQLNFTVRRGGDLFTETVVAEKHLDRDFRFGVPILMRWRLTPPRSDFDLGLGLVMDYTRTARVEKGEHRESHEFGLALNLLHYKSDEDGRELRLLWLIPISW